MTAEALRRLGFGAYEARRAIRLFRRHDEETVREMAHISFADESRYIAEARLRNNALNALFKQDPDLDKASLGWDNESLRSGENAE